MTQLRFLIRVCFLLGRVLLGYVFVAGATFSFSVTAYADDAAPTLVKPTLDSASGTPATAVGSGDSDKLMRVPTSVDDQRNARILNNLAAQSGWFPAMKIGVSNGMVSLEGHVKDASQLEWLAKTADRLPTVIAVINKATVDQPAVTDLSPAWNEFLRLLNRAKRALPLLLLAVALISFFVFVGKYISQFVRSIWGRHINNPFLLSTVSKITMIPIWILFFYLTLQTAGLSSLATTIIGGTGAVGIVIGFAFKDIAENYLSGLLLAIRSPFTKGDDVTVAGYDGYVQSLNMRGTTILAYDGTLVLVPNSIVIQQVIKNRTTNPPTRLSFTIGVGVADPIPKAIDLVQSALGEIPAILKDPAPFVVVSELTSSAVTLQSLFWIDGNKSSSYKTKSAAITQAKETLLANGISLPDTAREIVFTEALKVQQLTSTDEARTATNERSQSQKEKANANLADGKTKAGETSASHEADIKRLAEGVDIMAAHADATLLKHKPSQNLPAASQKSTS